MSARKVVCYCTAVRDPDLKGWLRSYDPEANEGRGHVGLTPHRAGAKVFADASAALQEWKRISKVRPVREDGKPNRPLSAFNMEIIGVDDLTKGTL